MQTSSEDALTAVSSPSPTVDPSNQTRPEAKATTFPEFVMYTYE